MEQAIIVLICILIFIILVPAALFFWIYIRDEKQEEHSVLRNYPVAGKLRYIFEKSDQSCGSIYSAMITKNSRFPGENMNRRSCRESIKAE